MKKFYNKKQISKNQFQNIITSKKIKNPYRKYNFLPIKNKLRVGFVSGDLFNHSVGYLLEDILPNINPNKICLFLINGAIPAPIPNTTI